ncbi:Protein AEXR-1 [Aphelenchoides avenae]|nr:Protein AEXR-1 [Aphelenchus avenae]
MTSSPMGNASSECAHCPSHPTFLRQSGFAIVAACFVAVVAQVLVWTCALQLMKKTQGAMHVFVITATLFDMTLTSYAYPAAFLAQQFASLQSPSFCWPLQFTQCLGATAAGLCVAVIASDRLPHYRLPASYRAITGKKALGVSLIVSLVAIGLVGALWAFRIVTVRSTCITSIDLSKIYLYDAFVLSACGVPVLGSCTVSTYLYFAVYRRRMRPFFRARRSPLTLQMESLCFLLTMSLLALVTLVPFRTFTAWDLHIRARELHAVCPSEAVRWTSWALAILLVMNPILKPFVVLMLFKPYRDNAKKLIFSIWCCARRLPIQS